MSDLRTVAREDVEPDPTQPRKHFGEAALADLSASIASLGIIEPLIVRSPAYALCEAHAMATPHGPCRPYVLIAGERRWRAAGKAGLAEVPVIVRDELDDREAFIVSMVENVLRTDLDPIEEADGYQRLLDDGLTIEEVSTRTGKRAAAIQSALTLRKLEPGIREMVAKGHLTAWDGGRLATLTWNGQNRALDAITRGGLTGNDRDRVIGQVWRDEHEMPMFSADEAPARARVGAEMRAVIETAAKALTRVTEMLDGGQMPDDVTIEMAEAVLQVAGAVTRVTRQAKAVRALERTA